MLLKSGKISNINERTNVAFALSVKLQDRRDVLSLAISGNCSVYSIALLMKYGASVNVFDEVPFLVFLSISTNGTFCSKRL